MARHLLSVRQQQLLQAIARTACNTQAADARPLRIVARRAIGNVWRERFGLDERFPHASLAALERARYVEMWGPNIALTERGLTSLLASLELP